MGSLYNLISSATNLTILKGIIDDHSDLKTLLEDAQVCPEAGSILEHSNPYSPKS